MPEVGRCERHLTKRGACVSEFVCASVSVSWSRVINIIYVYLYLYGTGAAGCAAVCT
jgi:hypothetical protein